MAVIYFPESAKIVKHYRTEASAKAALTRARNTGRMVRNTYFGKGLYKPAEIAEMKVCSEEYFRDHVDSMVEVKNLMSGGTVKIRKSDVGSCVDPSTERYWSM